MSRPLRYSPPLSKRPALTAGDAVIVLGIVALLYVGTRLAFHAPKVIAGPEISLSPLALPWYAALSLGRMTVAYVLSLAFSLVYGYFAARRRTAQMLLMPLVALGAVARTLLVAAVRKARQPASPLLSWVRVPKRRVFYDVSWREFDRGIGADRIRYSIRNRVCKRCGKDP
jgi:hypothetical protein